MKLVIEIALPEEALQKPATYANMVHNLLRVVEPKVEGLLSRSPTCVCTAPEADDQLRDLFGRVVGSLALRCDCGEPVRTGCTQCTNCLAAQVVTYCKTGHFDAAAVREIQEEEDAEAWKEEADGAT